ncbi:MAG: class I SAM-dependent methyltransferase [Chloroflexi bacterium]|nr:class I SAM-dependent methyltransferase [Chloroflexota bacterium]
MYDDIANYYDLTHDDLKEDVLFVLQLAQTAAGPILELGCGSGRLLRPLTQSGHHVTGIDNSAAMLTRARQRLDTAARQVTLVEADMTRFEVDGRFPLIIISYNTFMHLDSAQAAATLQRVKAHLAADGRLFIDQANPFTVAATPEDSLLNLENCLTDPDSGDIILHLAANRLDTVTQILHITWMYDRSPATGGPIHRTVAQTNYYFRYPHQMELLLKDAGFSNLVIWGDYNKSPFTEESDRFLILAG